MAKSSCDSGHTFKWICSLFLTATSLYNIGKMDDWIIQGPKHCWNPQGFPFTIPTLQGPAALRWGALLWVVMKDWDLPGSFLRLQSAQGTTEGWPNGVCSRDFNGVKREEHSCSVWTPWLPTVWLRGTELHQPSLNALIYKVGLPHLVVLGTAGHRKN